MPHNTKISPNTYLIIYMRKFMTFVMLAFLGSILSATWAADVTEVCDEIPTDTGFCLFS